MVENFYLAAGLWVVKCGYPKLMQYFFIKASNVRLQKYFSSSLMIARGKLKRENTFSFKKFTTILWSSYLHVAASIYLEM